MRLNGDHPAASAATPVGNGPPVFEARKLGVELGGAAVLHDVNLVVRSGEFVGLVGPNGAGKTTLLRAMLGLVAPSAGEVHVFGEPRCDRCAKGRIGYVSQHAARPPPAGSPFSVADVVAMGRAALHGVGRPYRRADREAAKTALERVGLAGALRRPFDALSGGQRQRVLLARALATDPAALVLDEPTTALDPEARHGFFELLDRLNHEADLTILMVSHDTEAVLASAHRVVVLNRTIVYDGRPADLLASRRRIQETLGVRPIHEEATA